MTYSYSNCGVKVEVNFFTEGECTPKERDVDLAIKLLNEALIHMMSKHPEMSKAIDALEKYGNSCCIDDSTTGKAIRKEIRKEKRDEESR